MRRTSTGIVRAVVLAGLLATIPACSGDEPKESAPSRFAPTGTPATPVQPGRPPAGAEVARGQGFTIAVPKGFRQGETPGSNGEPILYVRRASQEPSVPWQVTVLREPNPQADVLEQSRALELLKTVGPDPDFTRAAIDWPGADQAVLMQWTEPTGTERVETRFWQLSVQVDKTLALTVVALAPVGEFDASGVADILRSFRIA